MGWASSRVCAQGVAVGVFGLVGPSALGQINANITMRHGSNGNLTDVPFPPVTSVEYHDCFGGDLPIPIPGREREISGLLSINFLFNPDNNWNVRLRPEFTDTATGALGIVCGLFPEVCPLSPINGCPIEIRERTDYHVLRGAISLYVIQSGGGQTGGANFTRIASGTLSVDDILEVTSLQPTTLELPILGTGSLSAAESFGDPDRTYGAARLSITGQVAGTPVSITKSVTSVTTIPTQASLNGSQHVSIVVPAGLSTFPVHLAGEAYVEVKATSAGFYGTIVGSATATASFDNSLHIGRLTGAGGSPLPSGVRVRGLQTGVIYASTVCYANCDQSTTLPSLNIADFTCFLNLFASGGSMANCDGSTVAPVLNVGDFLCFLNAFAAGCS